MLTNEQKSITIDFLEKGDYQTSICFLCQEYLDEDESFTDFNGDKEIYWKACELIFQSDKESKIYIPVYGMDYDDKNPYIYAEEFWIETILSADFIKSIFEKMNITYGGYFSPSDIGVLSGDDISRCFLLGKTGLMIPMSEVLIHEGTRNFIYCWWD